LSEIPEENGKSIDLIRFFYSYFGIGFDLQAEHEEKKHVYKSHRTYFSKEAERRWRLRSGG
jgi:hypothetical protein